MRTRLSTPLTFLYKVALPWLYLLCIVLLVARWWGAAQGENDLQLIDSPTRHAVGAILLLVLWARIAWLTIPLKKVEMDDTSLYVSNYRTETQIPLAEIAGVRETSPYWFTIIVTLKNNSSFGRVVVFRPRHRFYLSGLHPVTRQLAELAGQARREAASCGQEAAHSK